MFHGSISSIWPAALSSRHGRTQQACKSTADATNWWALQKCWINRQADFYEAKVHTMKHLVRYLWDIALCFIALATPHFPSSFPCILCILSRRTVSRQKVSSKVWSHHLAWLADGRPLRSRLWCSLMSPGKTLGLRNVPASERYGCPIEVVLQCPDQCCPGWELLAPNGPEAMV